MLRAQWFSTRFGMANGIVKLRGGMGVGHRLGIAHPEVYVIGNRYCGSSADQRVHSGTRNTWYQLDAFEEPAICMSQRRWRDRIILTLRVIVLPASCCNSIGLSSSTATAVMAAFNACIAVGRLGLGVQMVPLFVAFPTAVGRLVERGHAAVGMVALTGLTVGYFLGSPIAGFLIDATGAEKADYIVPYRSATFYAAATSVMSTAFVLLARLRMDGEIFKKL
ncbi:putative Major facilitator superfamily domain-containing protein [Seiridium unicorne]|uniref:Major facilitator superfamily domain-containing protein n=1 Tax=Seiridium unicorne TaxID=138068 RepID=A0ABR2VF40_9PEZI